MLDKNIQWTAGELASYLANISPNGPLPSLLKQKKENRVFITRLPLITLNFHRKHLLKWRQYSPGLMSDWRRSCRRSLWEPTSRAGGFLTTSGSIHFTEPVLLNQSNIRLIMSYSKKPKLVPFSPANLAVIGIFTSTLTKSSNWIRIKTKKFKGIDSVRTNQTLHC